MKCPQCGHWNRASFPRCFRCGAELPKEPEKEAPAWIDAMQQPPKPAAYIQVNDEGEQSSAQDERDRLAQEMQSLHSRIRRGEEEQERLRRYSAERGVAPTSMTYKTYVRGETMFSQLDEQSRAEPPESSGGGAPERPIRYDDFADMDTNRYRMENGAYRGTGGNNAAMTMRQMRHAKMYGLQRFTLWLALLLLAAGACFAAYQFLYKPLVLDKREAPLQDRCIITSSILDDMAAHIIRIPQEEGAVIYITELRQSYEVIDGYATVEVADYTWYENMGEQLDNEIYTVSMTPYVKTSAGEQKRLETIHFDIEVPLATITLVTPDTGYDETYKPTYEIKFIVEKDSTVKINDQDYSDLVNNQDGLITYNASVSPIGDNVITIEVTCKYYRKNTATIVIHFPQQSFPLLLANSLPKRVNYDDGLLTVSVNTLAGATVNILTPYENLDTSTLNTDGKFKFQAKFTKNGDNDIIINATYPGKEPVTVKYTVYYLPTAAIYTRKAWPMDSWNYSQLLANLSLRIANTQIYVCKGYITKFIGEKPQLAVMETNLEGTVSRPVLLENLTNDTWVIGDYYRVYADVYGSYDAMPRLVGRYSYPFAP